MSEQLKRQTIMTFNEERKLHCICMEATIVDQLPRDTLERSRNTLRTAIQNRVIIGWRLHARAEDALERMDEEWEKRLARGAKEDTTLETKILLALGFVVVTPLAVIAAIPMIVGLVLGFGFIAPFLIIAFIGFILERVTRSPVPSQSPPQPEQPGNEAPRSDGGRSASPL